MSIIHATWEIRTRDGAPPIRGDIRAPLGPPPESVVVVCHGFKGFRRWGFFPSIARAIARHGHAAVTFDFSHNGVGEDGVDFSALDLFAAQTHSRNVDEIRRVLDAVTGGVLFPRRPSRIGVLGHSRGGGEAILAVAEDDRVDALVTWAAIAAVGRFPPTSIASWERGQTVFIENKRTGQRMPVEPSLWRDIVENRDRLDILGAAARIRVPWLLVHGEADETVPPADARALFDVTGEDAELLLVEGASHTFGAAHPYLGSTADLRVAADATLGWFDAHLASIPIVPPADPGL